MGAGEKEPFDELREYLEKRAREEAARPKPVPADARPFTARHGAPLAVAGTAVIAASLFYALTALRGYTDYLFPAGDPPRAAALAKEMCAANLRGLAGGGGGAPVCPASDRPYLRSNGRYCCPEPARHGLAEFCAGPKSPEPAAKPLPRQGAK